MDILELSLSDFVKEIILILRSEWIVSLKNNKKEDT